jgi:hypothetical protein
MPKVVWVALIAFIAATISVKLVIILSALFLIAIFVSDKVFDWAVLNN